MSEPNTTSSSSSKYYWIGCSGSGYVCMSEERLGSLLDMMPTLRFLLFGHPRMQPKKLQQSTDGATLVEISHELEISKKSFILLVNCVLGAEPLPARGTPKLTQLVDAMTTLGGCEQLEASLKNLQTNPLTPQDDTNNEYVWHVLQTLKYSSLSVYDTEVLRSKAGCAYASAIKDPKSGVVTHYFRAKKSI
ncbi:expressed unknown protein [Seminavis robusta]|uniref:Uncharacterized protein n=1 Tax=Seminavis robusta TaxID=568900 RepID=A0A9N8EM83_9STRA|nr:expressed unknown protein [Seminavis robusta]|eukprot:Sro1528_g279940.1 n/a (191) ;mRNA; f:5355-5927